MQKYRLTGISLTALLVACTGMLAAPGQQDHYTGTPVDIMRVRIVNSGRSEAVPVSVQELRTEDGAPLKVAVDPATVVRTRPEPMTWEYKVVHVQASQDEAAARVLNTEGAEGWETTGVSYAAPGTGTVVVLKRRK